MPPKQRLDLHLLDRGLASSRQQAQQWIRAGKVHGPQGVLDKPGQPVETDMPIRVDQPTRFVSRGGEKLVAALERFPIRIKGRVCLDGGISTGGFTDCLLQYGAKLIYGIDVGYGQTAWSLRTDTRLVLKERTNLRHLTADQLYEPTAARASLAVADVSFISLTKVLPALWGLMDHGENAPASDAVLLIKPQFEVGRTRVGKGGVVRDPLAHQDAIYKVVAAAAELGWNPQGLTASPITGPAGNQEYLLWLQSNKANERISDSIWHESVIEAEVRRVSSGKE